MTEGKKFMKKNYQTLILLSTVSSFIACGLSVYHFSQGQFLMGVLWGVGMGLSMTAIRLNWKMMRSK